MGAEPLANHMTYGQFKDMVDSVLRCLHGNSEERKYAMKAMLRFCNRPLYKRMFESDQDPSYDLADRMEWLGNNWI